MPWICLIEKRTIFAIIKFTFQVPKAMDVRLTSFDCLKVRHSCCAFPK